MLAIASRNGYKILAKILFQLAIYSISSMVTIAQENHSGFNIINWYIFEIPNVTIWSIFQNQVTYMETIARQFWPHF